MDFSKFKDKEYAKAEGRSVLKDFSEQVQQLKNVNADIFLEGFKVYFIEYLKNSYYKIDGRLSRFRYWMFVLYSFLVCMLAGIFGIELIALLALAVPFVCSSIRRLHDLNLTGKLVLVGIIPLLGVIFLLLLCSLSGDKQKNDFGAMEK